MVEEIREDVMVVVCTSQDVAEKNVELCGEEIHIHAEPPEAGVGLIVQEFVQTVLLAEHFDFWAGVESIQFLQQSLLIDYSSDFFTKI